MAKLFRVILPVGNLAQAVEFYQRVLKSEGRRVSPGRHYFDCEGTILACYDPRGDGDPVDAQPIPEPIYLAVDDIEEAFDRVKRAGADFPSHVVPGVGPLGEITRRPWGERSFYANDPFGNPLCFVCRSTVFVG